MENVVLSGFAKGCRGYTGDPVKSTAVFVPVRLVREDSKLLVIWACSLAERCDNLDCLYARRAHKGGRETEW